MELINQRSSASYKSSMVIAGVVEEKIRYYTDHAYRFKVNKEREEQESERKLKAKEAEQEMASKLLEAWEAKCITSLLEDQEDKADISAEQKVKVLRLAIPVFNNNGGVNWGTGASWPYRVSASKKSFEHALEFFKLNPTVTVQDILGLLGNCADINKHYDKPERGTYHEKFYCWKGGDSLEFFFRNLANIQSTADFAIQKPIHCPDMQISHNACDLV